MTPSAHTPPDAPAPWLDGKKVVVTGGTGFVGRHLLPQLLAAGARVTCITRATARRGGGGPRRPARRRRTGRGPARPGHLHPHGRPALRPGLAGLSARQQRGRPRPGHGLAASRRAGPGPAASGAGLQPGRQRPLRHSRRQGRRRARRARVRLRLVQAHGGTDPGPCPGRPHGHPAAAHHLRFRRPRPAARVPGPALRRGRHAGHVPPLPGLGRARPRRGPRHRLLLPSRSARRLSRQ